VAGWLMTHCLKHVSVTVSVMSNNLQTPMNSAQMMCLTHLSCVKKSVATTRRFCAIVVADRVIEASEA